MDPYFSAISRAKKIFYCGGALIRLGLSGLAGIAQTITGYSGYLNLWGICTQDSDI
jgi:hypothetical protein